MQFLYIDSYFVEETLVWVHTNQTYILTEKSGGGEEDSDLEDNVEGDVQKKIMPWKLMLPDDEVQDELEYSNRKRDDDGLVVVTSLIDKIPNLGGKVT